MIPTKEKLRLQRCIYLIEEGFTYEPETGKIYGKKGKEITSKDTLGYTRITISINGLKNTYLKGHQFAWYWVHKEIVEQIDHINGHKDDNRIINLRKITHQKNQWNQVNAKGYYWHKDAKKWKAQIRIGSKTLHLGLFKEENKAKEAYLEAKKVYHII
jgi:hypothetical protein